MLAAVGPLTQMAPFSPVSEELLAKYESAAVNLPKLQNIVSTAKLVSGLTGAWSVSLDLRKIALEGRNVEYNPKRFHAAIMKIRQPRTTALIF